MRRLGVPLLWSALIAAAAAVALATRQSEQRDSPLASAENPGAAGLRALSLYLAERGRHVTLLRAPLDAPLDVDTLVIAGPARAFTPAERERLVAFVEGGGRLLYLPARGGERNALDRWLGLEWGGALAGADLAGDALGANARVWFELEGVESLRVGADLGLRTQDARALPVAGQEQGVSLFRYVAGAGDVWVFAGPDALQNRRLALADNLALAARLLEGHVGFDEHHLVAAPAPALPLGIAVFVAQLAAGAVLLAFARGTRLGRPRDDRPAIHRSTREYLDAMANLAQRSRVEVELAGDLLMHLRAKIHGAFGISPALPPEEAALQLSARTGAPAEALLTLYSEYAAAREIGSMTPRTYMSFARRVAALEARSV